MKVLIVCSKNSGKIAPFITDQVEALRKEGVEMDYFPIEGKGLWGYLKNQKALFDKIKSFRPQLIHAHYGLSGLLANSQRFVPVITTYLGSDINYFKVFCFSRIAMLLSAYNIFVSIKNLKKSGLNRNQSLIAFGVETNLFKPVDKIFARKQLGLGLNKKLVLFAGAFNNPVKNLQLANAAVTLLSDVELLGLGGYTREQLALLLNAVNLVLMTSFTEGSPQIIKEAMACNCPVVSVPVGDVPEMINNIEGCFITSYEPEDIAEKLQTALNFGKLKEGRIRVEELGLDSESVARRILTVYEKVLR